MEYFLIIVLSILIFKIFYFNKKILGIDVKIKKTSLFFILEFLAYYHLLHAFRESFQLTQNSYYNYIFFGIALTIALFGIIPISKFIFNKLLKKLNINKYNIFLKNSLDKTLEDIDKLGNNGLDFELYIAKLFRSMGLWAKTTTELRKDEKLPPVIQKAPGSGEQGVDVIVFLDKMENLGDEDYDGLLIQCKQYSNTVGNKAVQEIVGALKLYNNFYNKRFKPVVITNNYFTSSAKILASSNDVELIDRDKLPNLIKESCDNLTDVKKLVYIESN